MRIKSYFAGTVEAAMDLARRELGEEAVLLNSRVAPAEARHLGYYEVVFGVEAVEAAIPPKAEEGRPHRSAGAARPNPDSQNDKIEELRSQVERLERVLMTKAPLVPPTGGFGEAAAPPSPAPTRAPLVRFLTERSFPPAFAETIAREVDAVLSDWVRSGRQPGRPKAASSARFSEKAGNDRAGVFRLSAGAVMAEVAQRGLVAEAVLAVLAGKLRADPEPAPGRRRVIALVGPPGSGKTVTLTKLAAVYGLGRHWNTAILSTDTIRIAAADQLRTYSAILGLPFELIETPRALDQAIAAQAQRSLVLIDTPGWSTAQLGARQDAGPWQEYFAAQRGIEVHLALPATLAVAGWRRAIAQFRSFGVSRLILTHCDAMVPGGAWFEALAESGLPVSFVTCGQSIPEDLEPAEVPRLLDLAFASEAPADPPGAPIDPPGFAPDWQTATAAASREFVHA